MAEPIEMLCGVLTWMSSKNHGRGSFTKFID